MIYMKDNNGTLKNIMDLALFEKCYVCGTELPFDLDTLIAVELLNDETFKIIIYKAPLCASCAERIHQPKKERRLNMTTFLHRMQLNEEKE